MSVMKHKGSYFFRIGFLLLFCLQSYLSVYCWAGSGAGQVQDEMTKMEKAFYAKAERLLDEEEYGDLIELCDKYIGKGPDSAIYHQFKGIGYVLTYAASLVSNIPVAKRLIESQINKAVIEFKKALQLDPGNEDRAIAGIVLAYTVSGELDEAGEYFEPAIKKYIQSLHLNYVGIKYYEKIGNKSESLICKNYVAANDPTYNGKPVFGGLAIVISVGTLVKVLTTAIAVSYVAGFRKGWQRELGI